jgi:hypothetical protein
VLEQLKEQGGNWTDIFKKGGIDGLLDSVKGTPLYDNLKTLMNQKFNPED